MMNKMAAQQQLDEASSLSELWKGLLPQYEIPSRAQFLLWAAMCPGETAVYALNRAARKAWRARMAGTPMGVEHIGRYITGIIRNERDGRHVFNTPRREALA